MGASNLKNLLDSSKPKPLHFSEDGAKRAVRRDRLPRAAGRFLRVGFHRRLAMSGEILVSMARWSSALEESRLRRSALVKAIKGPMGWKPTGR